MAKRMTVSREEQVRRMLESMTQGESEADRAAEAIRKGELRGHVFPNGDVYVKVDALSSVSYRRGCVTYTW